MNPISSNVAKLLTCYNINATSIRIQVLETLISIPNSEFTPSGVLNVVKKVLPGVSPSAIAETLALFKSRKIITQLAEPRYNSSQRKRGRPEARFVYRPVLKSESKNKIPMLDTHELETLVSLMKKSHDFFTLDEVDQRIFVWLLKNSPLKLRSWIDFLSLDYSTRKAVSIDPVKLLQEAEVNFDEDAGSAPCFFQ